VKKLVMFVIHHLRVPSGVYGTVIDAQVYSREGSDRDERLASSLKKKKKLEKDLALNKTLLKIMLIDKLKSLLVGKKQQAFF
jgi:DNA-directed RNA polymerase subunit beta